jgi:hypothetical protein
MADTKPTEIDSAEIHLDNAPQLLTDKQVAFVLDVDLAEVRRLKRRKLLRWLRFGGQDMSHTEDVRDLLRTRHLRRAKAA